jgi:hypothetical protein
MPNVCILLSSVLRATPTRVKCQDSEARCSRIRGCFGKTRELTWCPDLGVRLWRPLLRGGLPYDECALRMVLCSSAPPSRPSSLPEGLADSTPGINPDLLAFSPFLACEVGCWSNVGYHLQEDFRFSAKRNRRDKVYFRLAHTAKERHEKG